MCHKDQPSMTEGYSWRVTQTLNDPSRASLWRDRDGRVFALILADRDPVEAILFLSNGREEKHFFIDLKMAMSYCEERLPWIVSTYST